MKVVVGVGCSLGCPAEELRALIASALGQAELAAVATIDRRAQEPCVVAAARGVPLLTYTAQELARVPVPAPSSVVAGHVGTPSVAEAAALMPGGELVVGKQKSEHATCAVATWPG